MATPTYTPQDAITLATKLNHNAPSDPDLQAQACDMINTQIWVRFPWDWTLQAMTNITLTDGVQDYSLGGSDLTTFYRFKWIEIGNTSVTPNDWRRLNQKSDLSIDLITKGGIDGIRFFSWMTVISKIRLDFPAAVPSGTVLQLQGQFQTTPTKITSATLTTPLVIPDHYFYVFMEGVRWYFYALADDPRAGSTQEQSGRSVHTGQKATFLDGLEIMKRAEDFSNAEDVIYPAGGTLGTGRESYSPRLFW